MRSFLFVSFLFFVSFTSSAFAAVYTWSGPAGSGFPDAASACKPSSPWGGTLDHVGFASVTQGTCYYIGTTAYGPSGLDKIIGNGAVARTGDSCPAGATYNAATGACDAPPEDKCALTKGLSATSTVFSSDGSPPSIVSKGGCEFSVSGVSICKTASSGGWTCTATVTSTGNKLEANPAGVEASDCEGDSCAAALPQPENTHQDCVYSSNGSGSSSCTSIDSQSTPGTASCSSSGGAISCVENPKPSTVKVTTSSTKTPTTNVDGTITVVQDDTVTTVRCTGSSCNSSVTHSVSNTTTNSAGVIVGHTSTCTGGYCDGNGQATGPTLSGSAGSSGSGTGSGNGDGEGEEGDGDSPSVGTLTDPVNGSFDGQENEWDSKINDAKTKFQDAIGKLKDTFKPMGDVSLNGGSKLYCPPPVEVLGKSIDICMDKYADSLSWISDAILALCAMVALLIVFA